MVRTRAGAQTSSCPKGQEQIGEPGQAVKNLIVNADDLGWTNGVNCGTLEAFRHVIVSPALRYSPMAQRLPGRERRAMRDNPPRLEILSHRWGFA